MTSLEHKNAVGRTVLKLVYVYQDNDLLSTITETGVGGVAIATTSFIYDSRHRLTYEERIGQPGQVSYQYDYWYDQGGNRLVKSNVLTNQWDQYYYDVDDPTRVCPIAS